MRDTIRNMLMGVKREGMEELLQYLDKSGFFTAPASTKYHGASEGMLAEHSWNVMKCALELASEWLSYEDYKEMYDSIVICALLHDLGKAGQYDKPLYVANILKSGKPSDTQPYKRNEELLTVDHEIVSVVEASRYIELTEDEQLAILWHNGLYGNFKYQIQGKETPLYMIIHFADMWASRVVEKEDRNDNSGTEEGVK